MDKKKPKKNTEMLMSALESTATYDAFLEENQADLGLEQFKLAMRKYIAKYELDIKEVIKDAHIDRTYGYQIFNGRRKPSREKIIQMAFAMKLTVKECNHLLQCAEKQPLYAKVKRDSIIIYAFVHQLNINQLDQLLISHNFIPLNSK